MARRQQNQAAQAPAKPAGTFEVVRSEQYTTWGASQMHLEFRIRPFDGPIMYQSMCGFAWKQAMSTSDDNTWVCFRMHIQARRMEDMQKCAELLRPLSLITDVDYEMRTPVEILNGLLQAGFVQVVFDDRHNKYVEIHSIEPGDQYVDDYSAAGYQYTNGRCIATDERDAKLQISAQFTQRTVSPWRDQAEMQQRFSQWVAAGMPVKVINRPPVVQEAADLIAPPKELTWDFSTSTWVRKPEPTGFEAAERALEQVA